MAIRPRHENALNPTSLNTLRSDVFGSVHGRLNPGADQRTLDDSLSGRATPDEPLGSFRHREEGQLEREMTALDDTLLEKVDRLVDVSRQPLRWTSSTTVVIAQLVERIEALEAALREIADAVSAPGATDADYAATERRSSDRLSESIS